MSHVPAAEGPRVLPGPPRLERRGREAFHVLARADEPGFARTGAAAQMRGETDQSGGKKRRRRAKGGEESEGRATRPSGTTRTTRGLNPAPLGRERFRVGTRRRPCSEAGHQSTAFNAWRDPELPGCSVALPWQPPPQMSETGALADAQPVAGG